MIGTPRLSLPVSICKECKCINYKNESEGWLGGDGKTRGQTEENMPKTEQLKGNVKLH